MWSTKIFSTALLIGSALLYAQGSSSLSGDVRDASGSVVAGAAIVVTNAATNFQRSASTDTAGHYSIPDLIPGSYRVSAVKDGFARTETPVFAVALNQHAQLSL